MPSKKKVFASCSRDTKKNPVKLVEAAGNSNASVPKYVCDLGFAKPGAVVFERQVALRIIQLETAKAVGVCKFAEGAELIVGERGLQFELGFEKCHGESIAEERCRALQVTMGKHFVRKSG